MNICGRPNRKKTKIFYFAEWGRGPGERQALDIFTFAKPKNQIEKNHNKETLALLDVKSSQLVIETHAIGTGFIPAHKFKANFLDYYSEFVKNNKPKGNRHLHGSFNHFSKFIGKTFVSPSKSQNP